MISDDSRIEDTVNIVGILPSAIHMDFPSAPFSIKEEEEEQMRKTLIFHLRLVVDIDHLNLNLAQLFFFTS